LVRKAIKRPGAEIEAALPCQSLLKLCIFASSETKGIMVKKYIAKNKRFRWKGILFPVLGYKYNIVSNDQSSAKKVVKTKKAAKAPSFQHIDISLVSRLIAAQFPRWADLPIRPVEFGGWDNRTFHLGDHMMVRLPSAAKYAQQAEKEHRWLPKLAPLLPLPIPVPLAMGVPADVYPWHWSVYRWLEGENAAIERIADLRRFAVTLAQFLVALQRIDAVGGPLPGPHNFFRGGPLTVYDGEVRQAIAVLDGKIDAGAAIAVWKAALAATRRSSPVWFHGDVSAGNLLIKKGRLSAVIDFGCSGVGDPACDLSITWTFFQGEGREAFRAALPVDNAAWARGRGWTLWKALIKLAEFPGTNFHEETRKPRQIIDDVLADHKHAA
jgi:aminoglycoside phosphotransferase (APT) family kinase protein